MPDTTIYSARLTGRLDPAQFKPLGSVMAEGQTKPAGGSSSPKKEVEKPTVAEPADFERLKKSLEKFARSVNRDLNFRVDDMSGRTVITVLDGETKEVIRQIPSDEVLYMARLIADRKARLFEARA